MSSLSPWIERKTGMRNSSHWTLHIVQKYISEISLEVGGVGKDGSNWASMQIGHKMACKDV